MLYLVLSGFLIAYNTPGQLSHRPYSPTCPARLHGQMSGSAVLWEASAGLAGATLPQYDGTPGLRTVYGGNPDKVDTRCNAVTGVIKAIPRDIVNPHT